MLALHPTALLLRATLGPTYRRHVVPASLDSGDHPMIGTINFVYGRNPGPPPWEFRGRMVALVHVAGSQEAPLHGRVSTSARRFDSGARCCWVRWRRRRYCRTGRPRSIVRARPFFDDGPGEQYTVGEAVNVTLPSASGGNSPLTYSVTPALPAGLTFNATTRTIAVLQTTPQPRTEYAYTVTDADRDTVTIRFGITVAAATTSTGACRVGQELSPGDSCTVGSDRFEVLPDGRGHFSFITAGTGITVNRFRASRIPGTNTWRIDSVP